MAAGEKWYSDSWSWLALALLSPVLAWLFFSLARLAIPADMKSEVLAAWVQAVGSVIAILVSAVVVVWQVGKQAKHSEWAKLREELRILEGVCGVAGLGRDNLVAALKETQTVEDSQPFFANRRYSLHFDLIGDSLDETDANSMTEASLILALRTARREYHAALRKLDETAHVEGLVNEVWRQEIRQQLATHVRSLDFQIDYLSSRAVDIRIELKMPLRKWHLDALASAAERRALTLSTAA